MNERAFRKSECQVLSGPKAFASWVPWTQSRHAFVAAAGPTTRESFGGGCSKDLHCLRGCSLHWKFQRRSHHEGQISAAQRSCQGANINIGQQKLVDPMTQWPAFKILSFLVSTIIHNSTTSVDEWECWFWAKRPDHLLQRFPGCWRHLRQQVAARSSFQFANLVGRGKCRCILKGLRSRYILKAFHNRLS